MRPDRVSSLSGGSSKSKVELISRAGYVAKGIVYGTVGLLTLGALYNWFGSARITGTRGALEAIAAQPFGNILLILMMIGLAGYSTWRFVQAIQDAEDKGSGVSGILQRTGFMLSGLIYGLLALSAAKLAGWLGEGSGASRSEWAATLMNHQAGIWLIGLTGVTFVALGLYQFYRAVTRKFEDSWRGQGRAGQKPSFAVRFSQFGVAARGFTLVLIGWIIVNAAMRANPEDAKGLGHALQSLRDEAYGTVLLTLVGAGLLCYGLYCFFNAGYRKIQA